MFSAPRIRVPTAAAFEEPKEVLKNNSLYFIA